MEAGVKHSGCKEASPRSQDCASSNDKRHRQTTSTVFQGKLSLLEPKISQLPQLRMKPEWPCITVCCYRNTHVDKVQETLTPQHINLLFET